MKKKKRNSFLRRKKTLKAAVAVELALAKQRKERLVGPNSKAACNWRQKKLIMDYLEHKTEGAYYVPYDGYYYYEKAPSRLFYRLVPFMHKYPEALAWLNSYNELNRKHQKAYVCELYRRGVTIEVEMALIEHYLYGCTGCENLLIALHKQGHNFSLGARRRMKWRCPYAYQQIYPEDKD